MLREWIALRLVSFVVEILKPLTTKDTKVHEEKPALHFFGRKFEHGLRLEFTARLQDRRGKIRMVGRVREMLCFQAQAIALLVDVSVFSGDGSIQKITGIELNSRLGGEYFQNTSAGRLVDAEPRAPTHCLCG